MRKEIKLSTKILKSMSPNVGIWNLGQEQNSHIVHRLKILTGWYCQNDPICKYM